MQEEIQETQGRSPVEVVQEVWRRRKWLALIVAIPPLAATLSLV